MKINVYYNEDGDSIINILSNDFRSFLDSYVTRFLK